MDFGVVVGLSNKRLGSVVGEEDEWGSSKMAKTGLHNNSHNSLFSSDGHQKPQMLSFSCPNENSILPTYCHYPYNRTGVRGAFCGSQWMELQHQALIFKYITANLPIPSNLLIPITNSLLRPNTLGWGSFHGVTDPEPGRCRRTDGKKWRCSRDAVADQKYCERHINRGRHRSRKLVEGQPANLAKLMPTSSASAVASDSLAIAHQQLKTFHPPASNNRTYMNKHDVSDPKSKDNAFLIPKPQNPFDDASQAEFGLVPSDSLLNPSNKSSTLMTYKSFGSSQHSLRQFMDDWPKTRTDHSAMSWPQLDTQCDSTQLSISIPMAPNNDKLALSPLRLSPEFDTVQMGLGVGSVNETSNRQAHWIPVVWETSMGGPLGEVLHNTNNNSTVVECKNLTPALNLMTEGWDSSPLLGSSPTGVFGSLSNSSAGSSPRAQEGASLCNDLVGRTVVNSTISEMY